MNPDEPPVVPMIAYEDGPAAMDWLSRVFGFVEKERWLDDEGRLSHGEMLAGEGLIMLATPTPDYVCPRRHRASCEAAKAWLSVPWVIDGVLVHVEDVRSHFERSRREGATILSELEEGPPGLRYRAEDLEGHRWMFMERDD
jgi:uncharacterized glyoxalase superfamily protein PhnB